MINSIATHLNATTSGIPEDRVWANEFMNWLKSLKPQPKQEWSEKDEGNLACVLGHLSTCLNSEAYEMYKDWLKSLKPNHWKPSERQLNAIDFVLRFDKIGNYKNDLQSLLNQLQEL